MRRVPQTLLPPKFATWLTLKGRKPSTVKNLTNCLKYLYRQNVCLAENSLIRDFIASRMTTHSSSNINNIVDTCRVFAQFCKEENILYDPILDSLPFVKDKYRPKATMGDEEIENFLSLPPPTMNHHSTTGKSIVHPNNPARYFFWTVFFNILAYTGMRPGEVANLKVDNVDFGRSIFVLEDTKTNEPRYVPIPPNLTKLMTDWVNGKEGFLFPSRRPEGHVSNVEWHYNFQTRIKRLGIRRPNLTPYSLRHSLITRLLEEDVNIFKVQKIVGHRDVRTTARYTHLTTKDIQIAIQKHPLIRKYIDPKNILDVVEHFIHNLGVEKDARFIVKRTRLDHKFLLEIEVKP